MKILVVDDNRQIRSMFNDLLKNDHEVSLLTNGHNAVSLLSDVNHSFDLVFLDINMPRMSGMTLLNIISDIQCNQKTRFVVITGYPYDSEQFKAFPSVIEVLRKPFPIDAIHRIIRQTGARQEQRETVSTK